MIRSAARSEISRFLLVGATNTAASYVIYLVILKTADYRIAFSVSYVCGILISYLLNSAFVFRVSRTWAGLLGFVLVYIFQYFAGLALLSFQVANLGIPAQVAPLINVAVLVPVTYLLNRWTLVHIGTSRDG